MTDADGKAAARANLERKFGLPADPPMICYCRRDILVVPHGPDGRKQAFYRSRKGPGEETHWYPFDAVVPVNSKTPAMFDTLNYRCKNTPALDRYGTSELQTLGRTLDAAQLPPASRDVYEVRKVNGFIDTQISLTANALYDRYDIMARNQCRPRADELIAEREERRINAILSDSGITPAAKLPDGVRDAREVPVHELSRPSQLHTFHRRV
jgi:hypothetical protein